MVRAVGKYGLGLLITPHGDRKLPFVGAANAGGSSASLPLMGIGNKRGKHGKDRYWSSHYPSWLDRKTPPKCCSLSSSGPSLPLMGIGNGNEGRALVAKVFAGAHYPSWGSETVVGWPGLAPSQAYPSFSLPLMGIGNVSETRRYLTGCVRNLITPHGDRKRQSRMSEVRPPLSIHCSLPLMGIGNFYLRRDRHRIRLCSHYPSWGSETGHGGPRLESVSLSTASLPLMGIGNGSVGPVGRITPSVSSSLPLMGIGNCEKQVPCTNLSNWHHSHYPSWGSETPLYSTFSCMDVL